MLLAQIVRSGLLIDKLRKAVPVLFRCPKIRKAFSALRNLSCCEALFGFNIIYFDAGITLILMRRLINVIAGCRSDHKHCANDCRAPDCLTAEDRN